MRVQLIAVSLSVSACGASVASSSTTRVDHFEDPRVTVTTPHVQSTVTFADELEVTPAWKADVISAATPLMSAPDTVTRATEYAETRHEAQLDVGWEKRRVKTGASYTLSSEPDYTSHSVGLSAAVETFERRGTFGVLGGLTLDRVGRSDDEGFDERLRGVRGGLTYSHIMSPRLVLHGAYTLEHRNGFQANPYRLVPIFEDDGRRPILTLSENVPQLRTRHALEATAVWSASATTFVHGSYRLYLDDWGIVSSTAEAAVWRTLWNDHARLRLRLRGYIQEAAFFYQERYVEPLTFRTGDYRMSGMSTFSGGPRMDVRLLDIAGWGGFAVSASYDAMYFHLPQYVVLTRMLAHLLGLSITLEVD